MKVATVDVWDTLLRRHCHPDEVKIAAAGYVSIKYWEILAWPYKSRDAIFRRRHQSEFDLGTKKKREGFDDEYELNEVWFHAFERLAPSISEDGRSEIAADIARWEVQFEAEVTYPDPQIGSLLKRIAPGHNIRFLSDFYMTSDTLSGLIQKHHPNLVTSGVSSCSAGVNKRSGRLFHHFRENFLASADHALHVGDNKHSDFEIPSSFGLQSHHFVNKAEEKKRRYLTAQFLRRQSGDLNPYWADLTKNLKLRLSKRGFGRVIQCHNIGVEYAAGFVLYVLFAIEQARKNGVDKVYYFTREGEVLKKIHDRILEALPGDGLPVAEILEVSRIATFGASIYDLSLKELNRLWTMYPSHSIRTMLVSLGVPFIDLDEVIERHGFLADEQILHPWKDPRFLGLINDEAFRKPILTAIAGRRADLSAYLRQKGINDQSRRVVIVDIGWRGTIQDNLARVAPAVHWHGVYLGLFRFLNTQPTNVSKCAYFFDANAGKDGEGELTPQAPIEMLFNSEGGSVTGYRWDQDKVIAERRIDKNENLVYDRFTRHFHAGVMAATSLIGHYVKSRGLLSTDLSAHVAGLFAGMLKNPPSLVAQSYFHLHHNETFGNGVFVKRAGRLNALEVARHAMRRQALDLIDQQATESGWPSGFYAANRLTRLLKRDARARSHRVGQSPAPRPAEAVPTKLIQPLLKVVNSLDIADPKGLAFNEVRRMARENRVGAFSINWVIPDIGFGSGGHTTILRIIRQFQVLGVTNRVYVHGRSQHGSDEGLKAFIENHYTFLPGVEFFDSDENLAPSDVLVATLWITAYQVFKASNTNLKVYFIQDFEAMFYAAGSDHIFALNTYRLNFFGICASPWLDKVVTERFGMRACHFHLGYEPGAYYPDPLIERDANKILVYLRPTTPRRGTELLVAALTLVHEQRPKTRIVIFGTDSIGYQDISFPVSVVGLQNEEQLRRLHSGAAIALLTSLTNYSLLPIEAMACGAVVVDVNVESMRETFPVDAPIVLAEPHPHGIAKAILAMLNDPEGLQQRSQRSIDYARNFAWASSFAKIENALAHEYFGDAKPAEVLEGALVKAPDGSNIYHIEGGKRRHIPSAEIFAAHGFNWGDVREIPVTEILKLPNGGALSR
jgi:O-antigen biosynthesis protein